MKLSIQMRAARILIVQSQEDTALDLKVRLVHMGYEISGMLSSLEEAQNLATKSNLAFVDLQLVASPRDFQSVLDLNEQFHLPIIFVTSSSDDPKLLEAQEKRPFGFVLQPFENRELKTIIEITLDKHAVEEQNNRLTRLYATLSHVNQAVIRLQTRAELLQEACRVAVEFGKFRLAWIAWRNPDSAQLDVVAQYNNESWKLRQNEVPVFADDRPQGRGPVGISIREGHHVVVNSIKDEPSLLPWQSVIDANQFKSMAAFPIRLGNNVSGALAVYASESCFFKDKEITLLDEIAMDLSFAIEKQEEEKLRREAERKLKENEEHYRLLYQNAPLAFQSLNANGTLIDVNQTWLDTLGYKREEVVGRWFGDFLVSSSEDLTREQFQQYTSVGHLKGVEYDLRHKDGSTVTAVITSKVSSSGLEGNQLTQCVLHDISQIRRAEKALVESSQFYQQIISNAKDGILVCDENLTVRVWNPAMEQILGIESSQIVGLHAPTALHFLKGSGLFEELGKIISGEKPHSWVFHFENENRSGWIHQTNSPMRDVSGKVSGVIGVAHDITEQKRAEEYLRKSNEQLKESEERYRRLIELSSDTVIIQSEGKVVFINPAGLKLLGATHANQLLGMPILDIIHPDSRQNAIKRTELLTQKQTPLPLIEAKFVRLDGKTVDVEIMSVGFSYNKVLAIQITARDITPRKMMEARFLRDQRIETIGALASGIAHDLNNVLAPIIMTIALLRDKYEDEDTLALISAMETSAHRGASIIQQLLTFGRGASGQRTLIQPKHLLNEVAELARETFPKAIEVKAILKNCDWLLLGDATQLHQVLLNLCVNARDAMPTGGKLTITLDITHLEENDPQFNVEIKAGPYITISVQDTGKGVPVEIREKIFEPFFTTKELGKGTGLGLATCVNLVKRHNGFIFLAPNTGKGATFTVYLPAHTPAASPESSTTKKAPPTGNGELILVVDDEESIRKITRTALEKHGYKVITANDGAQAVATFKLYRNSIKAVLIDIMMPVMGGPVAMHHLRKIDPNVVLLATSGMIPKDLKEDMAELKPNAFLSKPFTTWELLDTIRTTISKANRIK